MSGASIARLGTRAVGRARRDAARTWAFSSAVAQLLRTGRAGGPPTALWIGDSHTVFFVREWPSPTLSRGPEGDFAWHLGPRVLFSLAGAGFPPAVRCVARAARHGRVQPVFVVGEIDVRCHLVPARQAGGDLGFVRDYVRHCLEVAAAFGSPAVVAVPVPPSSTYGDAAGFPVRGTTDERLAAFAELRTALVAAAQELGCLLLDATDDLMGEDGQLRADLTVDGCHVNAAGAALVRSRLASLTS